MLSKNFFAKKAFNISILVLLAAIFSSPSATGMQTGEDDSPKAVSKKNSQKSVRFYEKLMEVGQYEYALELLKSAYQRGELGVGSTLFYGDMLADEDLIEAIRVFNKLAKQGIPYAIERLKELEDEDLENALSEKEKKVSKNIWEEE